MAEDEVLDQDEIDDLLGSLSEEEENVDVAAEEGGEEPSGSASPGEAAAAAADVAEDPEDKFADRKIKDYDFKRPDKFSKDQIRTMQMIHETFARNTTTELSTKLRSLASLSVASVDQLSYEEFLKVVPNPSTLGIVDMDPLEGQSILEIDPSVVFQIVDRLFGGTEHTEPVDTERELTDIEHSVVERIYMSMLEQLKAAWENVIDLNPRLEDIESNPQFVQIIPPNDMVVLITFDMQIGQVEGMANLCIPYVILGPVIDQLSGTHFYSSQQEGFDDEQLQRLEDRIDFVEVPVSCEIGTAQLEMEELLNLEVGDVIRLDTDENDPFTLKINGRGKFNCKPGYKGRTVAVQILDTLEEEKFISDVVGDIKEEILNENEITEGGLETNG